MKTALTTKTKILWWHSRLGWLALIPALYMAITGVLVGLSDQIERIIEPRLFSVEPMPEQELSQQEVTDIVVKLLGDRPFNILPREAIFDTWQVRYNTDEQRVLWLNPHNGEVLAERSVANRPATIIKALHTGELLSWRGISVIASAFVLFVLTTGYVARKNHSKGRVYWHIQLAIIALPVVAMLALSGIVMSLFPSASWLYSLHSGEHLVVRFILIVSLVIFLFSLTALIGTSINNIFQKQSKNNTIYNKL